MCGKLTVSTVFGTLVSAQNTTNNTAASTFYLAKTETQFSVNIADESDDVFIYFTSPAYSWVGVGFGAKMDDSLMIIMYQSADGSSTSLFFCFHRKTLDKEKNEQKKEEILANKFPSQT